MKSLRNLLPQALLPWYREKRRQLPWREDKLPYHVWLSEIMLQQTRVEAVKGYYSRFLAALPTVRDLADCEDDKLHKLWEGLGYYSRVRNLKKAAQIIQVQYGGVFPGEYDQVLALPGIGSYTAGAICSICYDIPTPAVDGNVLRVMARITGDTTPVDLPAYKKKMEIKLAEIYPKEAGDFTQALMELGATVCGPNRKPDCVICPCKAFCLGYQQGIAEELPVRLPKRGRRQEDKTVFLLCCEGRYAVVKRGQTGLLSGLWQFPDVSGKLDTQAALDTVSAWGMHPRQIYRRLDLKHVFTHVQWNMRGYYLEVGEPITAFTWLTVEAIEKETALPTAYRQFWEPKKM